eukprot:6053274-Alexandrium_andersonii.AAC.1
MVEPSPSSGRMDGPGGPQGSQDPATRIREKVPAFLSGGAGGTQSEGQQRMQRFKHASSAL